eukprot:375455-Prymnesium_polylepis.1
MGRAGARTYSFITYKCVKLAVCAVACGDLGVWLWVRLTLRANYQENQNYQYFRKEVPTSRCGSA